MLGLLKKIVVIELGLVGKNDMIKYIYPERTNTNYNMYNQRSNIPIIHTNVSIYEQALMTFHELNLVPEQASQKILKLQFNSTSISVKRNFIQEIPQLIQKNNDIKSEPSTTLRTNQTINKD